MTKQEQRVYNQSYRKKNLKGLKVKAKVYAALHKDEKKKYDAERYVSNPKATRKRSRDWKIKNPKEAKISAAKWYQKNKERLKAKAVAYYENNMEKCKEDMKSYRKAHPYVDVVKHAKRRARETKAGGSFTQEEWLDLCEKYEYKCLRCKKIKPLAADHVIPVSKGGTSNIDNIQPLCKVCNSIKHTKTTDFRRPEHGKRRGK